MSRKSSSIQHTQLQFPILVQIWSVCNVALPPLECPPLQWERQMGTEEVDKLLRRQISKWLRASLIPRIVFLAKSLLWMRSIHTQFFHVDNGSKPSSQETLRKPTQRKRISLLPLLASRVESGFIQENNAGRTPFLLHSSPATLGTNP